MPSPWQEKPAPPIGRRGSGYIADQFVASNSNQRVAACDDRVKRALCVDIARQKALELFVDHTTDLDVVAKPQTLGVGGRCIQRHLQDRGVGTGVGGVVALLGAQVIGGLRDRQVARVLVPLGLHLGRGEEVEELGHAALFLGAAAG
jgi:hypothetical protein